MSHVTISSLGFHSGVSLKLPSNLTCGRSPGRRGLPAARRPGPFVETTDGPAVLLYVTPPSQNVFAVPKISSLEPSAQPATGTGAFPAQDLGVGYTCGHDRSPPFSVKSFLFAGRLAKRFDHDLLRLITKIFLVPMTPPSRCISEGGVHCLGDLIRFFRPNRFTFDHLMNLGFSWFFVVDNLHPFTNSSCSSFTIKECP